MQMFITVRYNAELEEIKYSGRTLLYLEPQFKELLNLLLNEPQITTYSFVIDCHLNHNFK